MMTSSANRHAFSPLILMLLGILASVVIAQMIAEQPTSLTLWFVGGVMLILVTFFHSRAAIYLIIFSMLLSPEMGTGADAGGRAVTVRLEDIVLLVVGLAWLARTAYRKELGLLRNSPLNWPIAAYAGVTLIATLLSGMRSETEWLRAMLFLGKYLEYFVLYFLVLTNVRSRADVKSYLGAALLTCAIVSLVGTAQIPEGARVSAPFEGDNGEPNTFGGYLVLMLSIVSGFFLTATSFRERLAWVAFGFLIVVPLLYTLSRSSWIAALAMIAGLAFFGPHKSHFVAAVTLVLALFPILAPRQVLERIDYTLNQPEARGQITVGRFRLDTSSSARIESWRTGLTGWSERPLTGHGVAGYYFMDAQYIRILTEAGILGMAAFAWLAWAIWRVAANRLRNARDRFSRGLALGYLAGYIAMLVHGIGANTFIIVRIMEPFCLLTALIVALPETEEPEDVPAVRRTTIPRRVSLA